MNWKCKSETPEMHSFLTFSKTDTKENLHKPSDFPFSVPKFNMSKMGGFENLSVNRAFHRGTGQETSTFIQCLPKCKCPWPLTHFYWGSHVTIWHRAHQCLLLHVLHQSSGTHWSFPDKKTRVFPEVMCVSGYSYGAFSNSLLYCKLLLICIYTYPSMWYWW